MATRLPASPAMRLARTPPEPPPITKRSKSYSAIVRSFDDFDVFACARDHQGGREPYEQAMLHHTGDAFQRLSQLRRVADAAEAAIVDKIAAIGAEGGAVPRTQGQRQVGIAE